MLQLTLCQEQDHFISLSLTQLNRLNSKVSQMISDFVDIITFYVIHFFNAADTPLMSFACYVNNNSCW